ncbi:MAG: cysteine desulfurase [Novosphingobium sp.]
MSEQPTILPGTGRGTVRAADGGGGETSPPAQRAEDSPRPLRQSSGLPPPRSGEDFKPDFPGLSGGWHYLDTAATAQKPQAVIDATVRAMGSDYATVHRGVYARSADMTLAFEAARRKVAGFIGGQENEIVFTRGATEAINLVAHTWGQSQLKAGDRILLSTLEHHSNIVPWQLLRDRTGVEIDVCPLTEDGQIDLGAAERMLTPAHKLVAFAHVSNVLGSVLDVPRAVALAHGVGAKILLDGCQAVPRLPVDVAAMQCDFYVFSAHKLYGPTGIGALWARAELLEAMPPWHGGGAMIDRVTFERTTYAAPPARFEAGTPAIIEAIGLGAAVDYVSAIGVSAIHAHEVRLVRQLRDELRAMNSVRLFGPEDSAGIVSFALEGVHPHDLGTILDEEGVAIRAGHHCAQPLMDHLGVPATARASFGIYNDETDIAALIRGIERTKRIFR